jgi:hypothetical protein
MRRFQRNLGGWPKRERRIFDAAAHRRMLAATDHLANAKRYLCDTAQTEDPAGLWLDASSVAACELIDRAWKEVHATNDLSQDVANRKIRNAQPVHINARYVSPSGVDCAPIAHTNNGWIVRFVGGNYAFDRFVSHSDFMAYTPAAPLNTAEAS